MGSSPSSEKKGENRNGRKGERPMWERWFGRVVPNSPRPVRASAVPRLMHHMVCVKMMIVWVPVEHDGNRHSSDEECDAIVALVDELLRRRVVDSAGVERDMNEGDILIVDPFNVQVHCLRAA